jgi:hypothetical protein
VHAALASAPAGAGTVARKRRWRSSGSGTPSMLGVQPGSTAPSTATSPPHPWPSSGSSM